MNKIRFFFISLMVLLAASCSENDKKAGNDPVNITDAAIKLFKKKIEQDPSAYTNYNNLAQHYMQKARESGDHKYYRKAGNTLDKSIRMNPDNYIGIVLRSKLAISNHNFNKALDYAEKAVQLEPERSFSHAVLGDALMGSGDVDKAMNAYQKMHEINHGLESFSRISRVRFLKGDTKGAVEAMEKAYESGLKHSTPDENLAWTQVMIGLYHFNSGKMNNAEKHYLKSLDIREDYYLGLEHLAELNAKRGDLEKAKKQYIRVIALNPAPEFHLAISGVYRELGNSEKADDHEKTAREMLEKMVTNGDKGYIRLLSNYYIDNNIKLDKALDLAKQDLELRKDIYTYDTIARAYLKNNNPQMAEKFIDESLKHGTRDAKLYYHAGLIHFRLKDYKKARTFFDTALEINPAFESGSETDIREMISRAEM